MALKEAVDALQSKVSKLTGIKGAPANPPEAANQFPFAVSYPRTGELVFESAGWANSFHTIYTEIHIARQILPASIAKAIPYYDLLASALLADVTLGGKVSEVRGIRYTFGSLGYGGIDTIGYRFEVDIKILQA